MNLSKQHKIISITDKEEITYVLSHGKRINTRFGPIFLSNIVNDSQLKFAVLLKKNIGKAFYRNYIKRLLRVYIVKKITLFKSYNRVIFLYKCRTKLASHNLLFSEYDTRLQDIHNSH